MPVSITWGTKVINVPQSYLTPITGTLYELDTEQFRLDLKALEDDVEGMPFPDTHNHNTEVTVAGVTYARVIEIINGYSITFEDGQYTVRLAGSNNNFFDVENGILNQNQVQIIAGNAAGLIVRESGISGLTQEESDALLNIQNDLDAALVRALGLMQENYQMDQCVYTEYQGQKLLSSARIRLYDTNDQAQWNQGHLSAEYRVSSTWSGQELQDYKVRRITLTTTSTTSTTTTI
jgi:hypothetical protein